MELCKSKMLFAQLFLVVFTISCSDSLPWDFSPEGTWEGNGKTILCNSDSEILFDLSFNIEQKGNVLGRMKIVNKDLRIDEENIVIGILSSPDGKTTEISGSLYDQDVFHKYLEREKTGINTESKSLSKDQSSIFEKTRFMLELPGYTPNFYFDLTKTGSWLKGYSLEGKVSGDVKDCKDQVISVELEKK